MCLIGPDKGIVEKTDFVRPINSGTKDKSATIEFKDYHKHMSSALFCDWFKDVLPQLNPGGVIVLDNASYHRIKVMKCKGVIGQFKRHF